MSLIFKPEHHEYISTDNPNADWISVTTFTNFFKQPFDAAETAKKSAKRKGSPWYGLSQEEILSAWSTEGKRATDLGSWYHDQREKDLCELNTIERFNKPLPIIRSIEVDGVKHAPDQKLDDGIYPEHFVYLNSSYLCGQSDYVEVIDGYVHINDYKTNKEIKTEGYTNWEGIKQKMQPPIAHLEDCHINHYALQLSMYMYMILKHNPHLKPGNITISHIMFEEAGKNQYNYPITALNEQGDPILKDIQVYKLPYLKEEILLLINWLKTNREKVKKK
jgi:hypothetical protein